MIMAFTWLWRIDFDRVLVQETSDRAVTTKKVTILLTFSLTYQESTLSKWYYHMIICIKMTSNVNKLSKYASNLFPGPKNLKFCKFWFYFLRGCRPLCYMSLPLMRALNWGIVWTFMSRGIRNTKSQTFGFLDLLNKTGLFWNFWLWHLVTLMPL